MKTLQEFFHTVGIYLVALSLLMTMFGVLLFFWFDTGGTSAEVFFPEFNTLVLFVFGLWAWVFNSYLGSCVYWAGLYILSRSHWFLKKTFGEVNQRGVDSTLGGIDNKKRAIYNDEEKLRREMQVSSGLTERMKVLWVERERLMEKKRRITYRYVFLRDLAYLSGYAVYQSSSFYLDRSDALEVLHGVATPEYRVVIKERDKKRGHEVYTGTTMKLAGLVYTPPTV